VSLVCDYAASVDIYRRLRLSSVTASNKPKLWHSHNSRSLRPLWALEEMGIDYDLVSLPFPPRIFQKDFLDINVLGTVPYFEDGLVTMTESTGICHYLVEKYQRYDLGLEVRHPEYGDYLNWLYQSDATLTFPQTLVLRYTHLEPDERKSTQIVNDYGKWFIARLRRLDEHVINRDYLCDDRFTIADIAVGFALYLGELISLSDYYTPQVKEYLERLKSRSAFQRSAMLGEELNFFKEIPTVDYKLFEKK
jgi:glutathione S-transferase